MAVSNQLGEGRGKKGREGRGGEGRGGKGRGGEGRGGEGMEGRCALMHVKFGNNSTPACKLTFIATILPRQSCSCCNAAKWTGTGSLELSGREGGREG